MILTILGGQTIFIACLLRLIFLSCLTQLEVEGGERERQRSWKTDESRMKERRRRERVCRFTTWHGVFHVFMHVCVCVRRVCAQSVQTATAADEARGPPDGRSSGSQRKPKELRQREQKKSICSLMSFLFSATLLISVAAFNFNGLLVLQTSCLLSHIKRSMTGFISRAGQIVELHTITWQTDAHDFQHLSFH